MKASLRQNWEIASLIGCSDFQPFLFLPFKTVGLLLQIEASEEAQYVKQIKVILGGAAGPGAAHLAQAQSPLPFTRPYPPLATGPERRLGPWHSVWKPP